MTLEQLRIFIAVAERAHVTRAAAALGLGQSAVSAAIAALEARHGTKLFHRIGRGIALTEAGEQFLGAARAVLAQADAAQALLEDLAGATRGRLHVQASHTIASYWLPRHLVAFRRAYPGIEIELTVGNTTQVARAVLEGIAEMGLVEGNVEAPSLLSRQVARDSMVLVVGPDHPWASVEKLEPAQLTQSEWVLREPGSGTRSEFEHALAGFGLNISNLRVALELPSNEAVRGAVEAGLGATALSASVAAPSLEAGLLRQVNLLLPERAFHLLRHKQRTPSRAGAAFGALIQPD
ncbi:LysR family transcriptional regulator [Acidocella aquatica]|uniref:LysR family transcriptional regulator n=1 Tax=Acidocella aquatica TaxID=1922313 RepID=A0ABQ6A7D4_9PROT|nr:LysR family transcriptional regulator [Acidocella aquatica]GLR67198.1 LysR family transcriptional regulator [Acidocella aquatica]